MAWILWVLAFVVGIQYFVVGLSLITRLQKKIAEGSDEDFPKRTFSQIVEDDPLHGWVMLLTWPVVMCCQLGILWVEARSGGRGFLSQFLAQQAKRIEERKPNLGYNPPPGKEHKPPPPPPPPPSPLEK